MRKSQNQIQTLRSNFSKLLDEKKHEQVYQDFLEQNSSLIPMEFIQNHGLHLDLVLRKLSIGSDYVTDFCYLSKSSADWHCILVEIEKPDSKYLNNNNEPHPDFSKALNQINKWRAWFESTDNKSQFCNHVLGPLKVPHGMARNPVHIKYLLVHGRRSEFENNPIKSSVIRAQERDDFKIISYDSLLENLNNKGDTYIGIRKNEYIQITSKIFVSDAIFVWMDPDSLRMPDELKEDILKNRHNFNWHSTKDEFDYAIEEKFSKLGISDGSSSP